MGVVIDSSVIVAVERRGELFNPTTLGIESEPVALAAMTASELLVGVHRADSERRRSERQYHLETLFRDFEVIPFDLHVARTHARLWAQLSAGGNRIGDHDLIIGATALAHGHSVLTDNLREFERIPGLIVDRPLW